MSTYERPKQIGMGLANAAFYCGMVGAFCALVFLVWSWAAILGTDFSETPAKQPDLLAGLLQLLLFLAAVTCGVVGLAFGAISGSQAKKAGFKPTPHGRVGLIMGIAALVLLLVSVVGSVVLTFDKTLRAPIEFKRRFQTAELVCSITLWLKGIFSG
jgi:hypothetical protein